MSLNLLPISPKKTTEMQIICSGVDGIKVQLWQAITGPHWDVVALVKTVLCQKGGTLPLIRHVHGSQGRICDLSGSHDRNLCRVYDPSGSSDINWGRICDPCGSRDRNLGRVYDPSGSSDINWGRIYDPCGSLWKTGSKWIPRQYFQPATAETMQLCNWIP